MPEARKRILLIGPMPDPPGGVSMHLYRLLQAAESHPEFSLSVLDLRKRKLFDSHGSSGNWIFIVWTFLRAHIIHIHISKSLKVWVAKWSKMLGKKIVYTQHNFRDLDDSSTRKTMQIAHRIVLVQPTPSALNEFENKISVIPAYIPSSKKMQAPDWFNNEIKNHTQVVLTLAYHEPGKATRVDGKDLYGFDTILNVFERMSGDISLKEFLLVLIDPNGTLAKEYEASVRKLQSESGMRILYVPNAVDVSSMLSSCKLFLRCTLADGDSLSLREALAAGIPAIASDCANRPSGTIVYKTGNDEDLRDKIMAVLTHPYRITFQQTDFSQNLFALYSSL